MTQYCPRIFHGVSLAKLHSSSFEYAPCCWSNRFIKTVDKIDFYHSDLKKLRDDNSSGHLPADYCSKCIEQENAGKKSMRQGYLETHGEITTKPTVQYLDINVDFTCNLACVTCGPELSTTWRKELKVKDWTVRPNFSNLIENYIKPLDLSQIREVRIWGGEPLMTLTHKQILQYLIDQGLASQTRLMYNTNGTQRIDAKTKSLMEEFKFVRISFSIDAIGDQFEYIRYPAEWKQVEENLIWWKNNLPHSSMLSITATASVLNVLDLDSVFDWHRQNFSESVYGDEIEIYVHLAQGNYSLEYMPDSMVEHLKSLSNYSQPWIQKLESLGTKSNQSFQVKENLIQLDRRRNLDFSRTLPKLAKHLSS